MKKKFQIISVFCALAAFGITIRVLSRTAVQHDSELRQLTKEKAGMDALLAENSRMKHIKVDEGEIARLEKENADLPVLRNQVHRLRDALMSQELGDPEDVQTLRAENKLLQQQKQELQRL